MFSRRVRRVSFKRKGLVVDSRSLILNTIKKALADVDKAKLTPPETPPIWDLKGETKEVLQTRFAENLKSVAGEVVFCADANEAGKEIARVLKEIVKDAKDPSLELGVYNSLIARSVADEALKEAGEGWKALEEPENPDADPKVFQTMTASLISPLVLLTDTGSCVVEASSAFERFLCYLSPVCFVVAKASQLREHLPHAWNEIEAKMRNESQRGEIAIITGPSRTADIEKKLVLGVHGPRRLIVFLIND